ncbi:MAG: acyl-CoA carboxylase subunit beta [Thaumarchaeota archaeon]|nr:acyl-CoA carboxylase subunit beta [Nitrososphaerota archaeon]
MNRAAEQGGGKERIDEQHKKGKLTARERIGLLLDPGTFNEMDKFVTHRSSDLGLDRSRPLGDGVVTGFGKIDGRLAYVYAHDFTVFGGSLGEAHMKKITKVMDLALKNGAPIVGLNDSGGARIQEGVSSLAGVSEMFFRNTLASGVIPQISAVLGPSAGAAVYSPAMTDFVFMVKGTGQMFVTGPDVVKAALGETVTFEELGGAMVHASQSGVAHFMFDSEKECLSAIRRLLSFLPQNNSEPPPAMEWTEDPSAADPGLDSLAPAEPYKAYDIRGIIQRLLDGGDYLEVHAGWAQNVTVGFGRLAGSSIGVVANQPMVLSGALDVDSADKAARFVRFCDSFNIPILTLVDVPGYLPGSDQEHRGLIRHGSKLLYAYCEATVPKVTLIVKKAYGGAYCAMGSKYSKADINYAWPGAEIAVMGPEGAINIIYRKEIETSSDKEGLRKRLTAEYRKKFANPYVAASRGIIDEIILPSATRPKLIAAFGSLKDKSEFRPAKKHGNIQL